MLVTLIGATLSILLLLPPAFDLSFPSGSKSPNDGGNGALIEKAVDKSPIFKLSSSSSSVLFFAFSGGPLVHFW